MRNLVVLSLAILICQATLVDATDFSLFAETTSAYILPEYEPISLDDAVHSSESILWQIDFSIMVEDVSPSEMGFGTLTFDINLVNALDSQSIGWVGEYYHTEVGFTRYQGFAYNVDSGVDVMDLRDIYLEIGYVYPPVGGRNRLGLNENYGKLLIGSIYIQDIAGAVSSISVDNVLFSAIRYDETFVTPPQSAQGQSVLYLPSTLGGSRLIHVSTAIPEPHSLTLFLLAAITRLLGRRTPICLPARRM